MTKFPSVLILTLLVLLAACTPIASNIPPPSLKVSDAYPAPVSALSAYPGPGSREPVQAPDESTLIHRLYMPVFKRTTVPSILGWEAASDGQALAARAAILSLPPATVRTGIPWKDVEPVRGAGYVWSASKDAHINLLTEGGNRIIGVLNWPPQWAMITPGCSPVSPVYYADWLAYVRTTVQRYGDRVDVWEVTNEPDAPISPETKGWGCWGDLGQTDFGGRNYGLFAAITAKVIREMQPDTTIISGGLALGCDAAGEDGACVGDGLRFLAAALPWMEDDINGVGFHNYEFWQLRRPTQAPQLRSKVLALRKLTKLPLFLTEGGFLCWRGTDPFACASLAYEGAQEAYVGLWSDACRELELSACVLYSLTWNGWQWADLMNRDRTLRLGFLALMDELRR